MVFDIFTLVEAVFFILPAYAANGLAPLFRGKHAIDGGKTIRKQPILGAGKTWEGLIGGIVVAGVIGLVEQLAFPFLPWSLSPQPLVIVPMTLVLGLIIGAGAMFGDLCGAFIKRRCGIERGRPAPLLDQEDFLVGAFAFAWLIGGAALQSGWFVLLFVLTPALHVVANVIGFLLKVKKEPW
ncbi:MAG: CDP-2,3-bis-(O-geranylgeranyl)-sn-glycerol synthase [Candidatus Aenigmarchaeota archaeon]|nr:CDP-2,3-bis-(O-geranylgeranyl)-sn-glycerol synthase [Candidatus Aenigmarchaeota archaeon]